MDKQSAKASRTRLFVRSVAACSVSAAMALQPMGLAVLPGAGDVAVAHAAQDDGYTTATLTSWEQVAEALQADRAKLRFVVEPSQGAEGAVVNPPATLPDGLTVGRRDTLVIQAPAIPSQGGGSAPWSFGPRTQADKPAFVLEANSSLYFEPLVVAADPADTQPLVSGAKGSVFAIMPVAGYPYDDDSAVPESVIGARKVLAQGSAVTLSKTTATALTSDKPFLAPTDRFYLYGRVDIRTADDYTSAPDVPLIDLNLSRMNVGNSSGRTMPSAFSLTTTSTDLHAPLIRGYAGNEGSQVVGVSAKASFKMAVEPKAGAAVAYPQPGTTVEAPLAYRTLFAAQQGSAFAISDVRGKGSAPMFEHSYVKAYDCDGYVFAANGHMFDDDSGIMVDHGIVEIYEQMPRDLARLTSAAGPAFALPNPEGTDTSQADEPTYAFETSGGMTLSTTGIEGRYYRQTKGGTFEGLKPDSTYLVVVHNQYYTQVLDAIVKAKATLRDAVDQAEQTFAETVGNVQGASSVKDWADAKKATFGDELLKKVYAMVDDPALRNPAQVEEATKKAQAAVTDYLNAAERELYYKIVLVKADEAKAKGEEYIREQAEYLTDKDAALEEYGRRVKEELAKLAEQYADPSVPNWQIGDLVWSLPNKIQTIAYQMNADAGEVLTKKAVEAALEKYDKLVADAIRDVKTDPALKYGEQDAQDIESVAAEERENIEASRHPEDVQDAYEHAVERLEQTVKKVKADDIAHQKLIKTAIDTALNKIDRVTRNLATQLDDDTTLTEEGRKEAIAALTKAAEEMKEKVRAVDTLEDASEVYETCEHELTEVADKAREEALAKAEEARKQLEEAQQKAGVRLKEALDEALKALGEDAGVKDKTAAEATVRAAFDKATEAVGRAKTADEAAARGEEGAKAIAAALEQAKLDDAAKQAEAQAKLDAAKKAADGKIDAALAVAQAKVDADDEIKAKLTAKSKLVQAADQAKQAVAAADSIEAADRAGDEGVAAVNAALEQAKKDDEAAQAAEAALKKAHADADAKIDEALAKAEGEIDADDGIADKAAAKATVAAAADAAKQAVAKTLDVEAAGRAGAEGVAAVEAALARAKEDDAKAQQAAAELQHAKEAADAVVDDAVKAAKDDVAKAELSDEAKKKVEQAIDEAAAKAKDAIAQAGDTEAAAEAGRTGAQAVDAAKDEALKAAEQDAADEKAGVAEAIARVRAALEDARTQIGRLSFDRAGEFVTKAEGVATDAIADIRATGRDTADAKASAAVGEIARIVDSARRAAAGIPAADALEGAHRPYISGFPDGTFRPYATATRAEVAKMLVGALGLPTKDLGASKGFTDVKAGQWYTEAVNAVVAAGYMKGDAAGTFRPNAAISRAEMVQILFNVSGAQADQAAEMPFVDVKPGFWGYKAIAVMSAQGLAKGYESGGKLYFKPNARVNRAETVAFLNRYLGRHTDEAGMDAAGAPQGFRDVTAAKKQWFFFDVMEASRAHEFKRDTATTPETWTKLL